MQRRRLLFISVLGLVAFAGCAASYTPPPLTTQHPAHAEAMAAPALPPSNTLTYGPADIPARQPAVSMARHEMQPPTQHGKHGIQQSAQAGRQTVVGEGKVIAVMADSGQLVVDHKEIKGFMGAMTMGYRVDPPSLLERVKAGDMIRFTIDTQRNAIVEIDKRKE